jgi:GAF domain-containing protein
MWEERAMRAMLEHMVRRLLPKETFEETIHSILDDVIALHGAEFGNIQLPVGDDLVIVAQRGLSEAFLQTFRRVRKDDGCACGRALRSGASVIIRDVEKDPEFAAFRKDAASAGFRAVQSTPMFNREGKFLGVISTHFAQVHEPTEIEMAALKEYGFIAADHAFLLLGASTLAEKAEQMNAELYNNLENPESEPPPRAPDMTESGRPA